MRRHNVNPALIGLFFIICTSCTSINKSCEEYQRETISWLGLGSIFYGNDKNQYIEITVPKNNNQNIDIILYIKGYGNKMVSPTFLEKYRDDFIIGKLNFRHRNLGRNNLGLLELLYDVHNGLSALKNTVEEKGINVNKVIIIGSSLGGTLALTYSYTFFELSPVPIAFCISMAGLTDVTDSINPLIKFILRNTNIESSDVSATIYEELNRLSPLNLVNELIPPTILIHDSNDRIVPFTNSISLCNLLNLHGVPNIFILSIGNSGHILGSNIKESNGIVYIPDSTDSSNNRLRREIREIHPTLEEILLASMNQYISEYCQ